MPKLPHIKNSEVTAEYAEPVFSSLFELTLMPPAGVVIPDTIDEQIQSISGLGTLDNAPDVVSQKVAQNQSRQFSALTVSNIHNLTITMNLNLHGPDTNDPVIYNAFQSWNAKRRNPLTGAMGLKKGYVGSWILVENNQVGTAWRVTSYKNGFPKGPISAVDSHDKNSDDIYTCQVTLTSELAVPRVVGSQF